MKKFTHLGLHIALVCSLSSLITFGKERIVPSAQYPTIQSALDACKKGDTVLVNPGTYKENLRWPIVRDIEMISSGNAENTIIDGGQAGNVLNMQEPNNNIVSRKTKIKGFTFTNGSFPTDGTFAEGGAALDIWYSGPSFVSCNFIGNNASGAGGVLGGIIYLTNSRAQFSHCLFENNTLNNYSWVQAGLIYSSYSKIRFSYCTIKNNVVNSPGQVTSLIENDYTGVAIFDHCIIKNDTINAGNTSLSLGFITANQNRLYAVNCEMTDNVYSSPSISGDGSFLTVIMGKVFFNQVTLANNISSTKTPTIYIEFAKKSDSIRITNSIIWNPENKAEFISAIDVDPRIFFVSYSDIRKGFTGTGNINADPKFNGDHDEHLELGSPCINAGTLFDAPADDLEDNARPLPINSNPDMGCYEIDQSHGITTSSGNVINVTDCAAPVFNLKSSELMVSNCSATPEVVEVFNEFGQIVLNKELVETKNIFPLANESGQLHLLFYLIFKGGAIIDQGKVNYSE